jgi:DNA-binding FadR family transcriptional regulator
MSAVRTLDQFRVSRAEALARALEGEILEDALPPGHRLGTKEELKRRFGVAVATVNEAIRMLEMRGLIEARPGPGGGVFVAGPSTRIQLSHLVLGFKWSPSTVSDCLAIRMALEPLVCREAGAYRSPADVRALRGLLDRMERHRSEPQEYLRCNWALHRRIAKICRNVPLSSIYLTLLDFLEEGLDDVREENFDGRENLQIHRELVDAIDAGDESRLETAIAQHAPTASTFENDGRGAG